MGPPPPSPRIEGQQAAHLHHQQQQQRERSNNRWSSAARPAAVPVLSSYAALATGPPPSFAAAAVPKSSGAAKAAAAAAAAAAASNSAAAAAAAAAASTSCSSSNRDVGYRGAPLSLNSSSSAAAGRGTPRRGSGSGGRFDGAGRGGGARGGRIGYRGGGGSSRGGGGDELSLSGRRGSMGGSSDGRGRGFDGRGAGRGRGRSYFERGGGRNSFRGGGRGGRMGDDRRGNSLDRQDSFSGMDPHDEGNQFHSRGSFADEGRLSPYGSYSAAGRGPGRQEHYGDSPPGPDEYGAYKRRRGDESFAEYSDDKRMRETGTSTPPPERYGDSRDPPGHPPLAGDEPGQYSEAASFGQQPPPPPPPPPLPNHEPNGDLSDELYRNADRMDAQQQQETHQRNPSWTGPGGPPGLSSPHQQPRRSMYSNLDSMEPPYSSNDRDFGGRGGRGRGVGRGRGFRGGRGERVVSDYSSIAAGDYARIVDGPPTRTGSSNRLSITAPDASRGPTGEPSPRFGAGHDAPWKRTSNDFGSMAGPPPSQFEESPRGGKPSPRDWRAPPASHYGAMSASSTPMSVGSGMRSHLTPTSGDFPMVPFPGPPQHPPTPPPVEEGRAKTPPPSPGSPSGLAVAITRLTDLEAQMEFAYAKFILMMKRHEIIKSQYHHMEKLPVGVDAFKEDLEKLVGGEGNETSGDQGDLYDK